MPDSFERNEDGCWEIQPEALLPEKIVITRQQADAELLAAQEHLSRLQAEVVSAQENVDQKQFIVNKCIEHEVTTVLE